MNNFIDILNDFIYLYFSENSEMGKLQDDCKEWRGMRRAYGAVWDMPNPPEGSITLRFQVSGSMGMKWIVANNAIPADWKAGVAYDSAIQLY